MPLKKLFTLKMLELDSIFIYSATAISVVTQPRILVYMLFYVLILQDVFLICFSMFLFSRMCSSFVFLW